MTKDERFDALRAAVDTVDELIANLHSLRGLVTHAVITEFQGGGKSDCDYIAVTAQQITDAMTLFVGELRGLAKDPGVDS